MKIALMIGIFAMIMFACVKKEMDGEEAQKIIEPGPEADVRYNPKKGFGIVTKNTAWNDKLELLHVRWHYSWGHERKTLEPDSVEFVPMIWGAWADTAAVQQKLDRVKTYKEDGQVQYLLGFNEPDGKSQANMSVATAINYWPKLMEVGLPLGSPAAVHADGEWMQHFMNEVDARDYRVSFIAVHWYGDANVESFINHLRKVHKLYHRPIWITEFAPADWSATSPSESKVTKERATNFMKEVLQILDTLSFVERYAWFSAKPDNPALGNAALFNSDGSLTPLGNYYRNFH